VAQAARAFEFDRYLAALLAPEPARPALLALAAFAGELRRIPMMVSEPMMGHLRLQWWRDTIAAARPAGHPIADALSQAVERHALPRDHLIEIVSACEADLDAAPFTGPDDLLQHLAAIEGRLFALAGMCLSTSLSDDLTRAAGRAYGVSRLLAELPALIAQGRCPVPRTRGEAVPHIIAEAEIAPFLAHARADRETVQGRFADMPRPARVAVLPVALVGPYLRVVERGGTVTAGQARDVVPLAKVWRLWRAHRSGRIRG
jgi:phytoene synthase